MLDLTIDLSHFFRAHWFLVVVCFPSLEDVQYEKFHSSTGKICRSFMEIRRNDVTTVIVNAFLRCGAHDASLGPCSDLCVILERFEDMVVSG